MNEQTQPLRALGADIALLGSGFDVAKTVVDGKERIWSQDQFSKLPLLDRVRLLAGGELRFFRKGQEVPPRDALRGL
jgi:hypothetical protein